MVSHKGKAQVTLSLKQKQRLATRARGLSSGTSGQNSGQERRSPSSLSLAVYFTQVQTTQLEDG